MIRSRRKWLLLALVASVMTSACATQSREWRRSDPRTITAEELSATSVGNLFEAVQQLRPQWLRTPPSRSVNMGTEIVVVQDGTYFGGVETLRLLAVDNVRELRYIDGSTASASIGGLGGGRHVAGAILVSLRRD